MCISCLRCVRHTFHAVFLYVKKRNISKTNFSTGKQRRTPSSLSNRNNIYDSLIKEKKGKKIFASVLVSMVFLQFYKLRTTIYVKEIEPSSFGWVKCCLFCNSYHHFSTNRNIFILYFNIIFIMSCFLGCILQFNCLQQHLWQKKIYNFFFSL